jgi:hypothetical protein
MGSTPSTIQLVPEIKVSIEKENLRPWQRTMTVSTGGSLTIDATLEALTGPVSTDQRA